MSRLARYIASQVLAAMLLVLCVLGGLDLLLYTIDELGNTRGGYGVLQALRYISYIAPRHLYELLPASALIGALAGLGSLAASNELVGMQAAGYSRWQITLAVMQPAMLVMVLGLVLGEYVAPRLEIRAEVDKSLALGLRAGLTRFGHWERDGGVFLHFNSMETQGILHGVTLFEFDDQQRLVHQVEAELANFQGAAGGKANRYSWQMVNGNEFNFTYQGDAVINTHQSFGERNWELDMTPELLQVLVVDPASMAISDLWRFGQRFLQQGLDSGPYFLGFWRKALQPLNTGVLVLVAISFIFGPLRSASMGLRVFSAICLGLTFTIVQKLFQQLSLVYHMRPLFAVLLPILLCFVAGVVLLKRRA